MKKYLLLIVLLVASIVIIPFMHLSTLNTILSEAVCVGCLAVVASLIANSRNKEE